ncbi:major capsid protein [Thauera chlorobenzoica]|uniref:Major head protein n=1 Tax=Thauera chlorobenzoica TaxID=96773 RepID=A0A1H5Z789_9RHOO|nr:major capsid protein [Thauera chlorobenzoica]APR05645.1 Major head protein [Thauera chlorobenzoica]SEG31545.1 Phage major capsid protein E [Thauera chlorobenzoica]
MDIFTIGVLRRVVEALPEPQPFFLNSFFREEQREDSEEIHFDLDTGKRRIAPFVAPIVAGKVVQSRGYVTKTFKPAYVKDKRVFDSSRPFKRAIGERIGGEYSPAQRQQLLLARDLQDQIDMLTRRLEVMAVEALRTGKVVVKGDEYPEVEVNFQRHADLTKALTTTARWGESGVKPLDDLQTWSLLVSQHSGATANTVVMDLKAWQLFSADAEVQKLLDRFRGRDQLNPTVTGEGARYMGNVGDFDIWVHTGWYEHPDTGAVTPYLPDYTVLVISPELDGVRCFGAIKDEEAGFQALPYFPKSWLEKDPAVRYLLMQSAPLPVPYRVNASFCATVR